MSQLRIVDSHCHLDDRQFNEDREAVIERALSAGVESMLAVGTGEGPPDLEAGIRLAERYPLIHATVGIHPHDAAKAGASDFPRLRLLLDHPRVAALGEIGLDYHYNFSSPERQREVFTEQLGIAAEARVPVIIHTREAWDDTFRILEAHWSRAGLPGIMHCFSGGPEEARRAMAMGFSISFAGVVTYPKAVNIQEAAKIVPDDRLLVETDAPYLAPIPKRGKRNEPSFVVETVKKLAALRGQTPESVAMVTTANFHRLCQAPASSGLPGMKANG